MMIHCNLMTHLFKSGIYNISRTPNGMNNHCSSFLFLKRQFGLITKSKLFNPIHERSYNYTIFQNDFINIHKKNIINTHNNSRLLSIRYQHNESITKPSTINIEKDGAKQMQVEKMKQTEIERTKRSRVFTVSNILSMCRILSIPVISYYLVVKQNHLVSSIIIFLSSITDFIDGYIARKFDQITDIGTMLDPLADKLLVTTLTIALCISGLFQPIVAGFIILRDISLTLATIIFRYITLSKFIQNSNKNGNNIQMNLKSFFNLKLVSQEVKPPLISKVNTFLQMITLITLVGLPLVISLVFSDDEEEEKSRKEPRNISNELALSKYISLGLFKDIKDKYFTLSSNNNQEKKKTDEELYNDYWMLAEKEINQTYVVEMIDDDKDILINKHKDYKIGKIFCVYDENNYNNANVNTLLFGEPNSIIVQQIKELLSNETVDLDLTQHKRYMIVEIKKGLEMKIIRTFDYEESVLIDRFYKGIGILLETVLLTTIWSGVKYAVDGKKLLRVIK